MHAECLDVVVAQDLLLAAIDIAQTNVHQLARADNVLILEPAKDVALVFPGQPGQEGHGHTVNVTTRAQLGQVDVGMSIDPDHRHLAA